VLAGASRDEHLAQQVAAGSQFENAKIKNKNAKLRYPPAADD
jgi:hypothetical protein